MKRRERFEQLSKKLDGQHAVQSKQNKSKPRSHI